MTINELREIIRDLPGDAIVLCSDQNGKLSHIKTRTDRVRYITHKYDEISERVNKESVTNDALVVEIAENQRPEK